MTASPVTRHPSLTLSRAELQELSGRERPSAVCRWLERQRIAYITDADGWPKVLRSALLDRATAPTQTAEPRLRFA